MSDSKIHRIIRQLGQHLDDGNLQAFAALIDTHCAAQLFETIRTQKLLIRGSATTRSAAAAFVATKVQSALEPEMAAEYARYAALCAGIGSARDQVKLVIEREQRAFPKLSLRQLLHVAERSFDQFLKRAQDSLPNLTPETSIGENERRLHERSGDASDLLFAVTRALNDLAVRLGERDLRRADALVIAAQCFRRLTTLASQLNSLDYVLDSASYGDFFVTVAKESEQRFQLDFVDPRRVLLRQLHLRRLLVHMTTGLRNQRFVREKLLGTLEAVAVTALDAYAAGGVPHPDAIDALTKRGKLLLRTIDAEDDLLYVAAGDTYRPASLYQLSLSLRLFAAASALIKTALPGRAQRELDETLRKSELIAGIRPDEAQLAAEQCWPDLVVRFPARSHFEILRRPFIEIATGEALPFRPGTMGAWATAVRETLIKGGETGRRYGAVWEEFYACSFADTGWTIAGRNIKLSKGGQYLTEVDLLLLREDLLLVVEVKALTGSGVSTYDHWKNRIVIEKGCRQASLAADHLKLTPGLLASLTNRRIAASIRHIQPVVLTNEGMFDGWEYDGVPVIGETIRKAITEGSRVEYIDGHTLEVQRVDRHLRFEDLSTETHPRSTARADRTQDCARARRGSACLGRSRGPANRHPDARGRACKVKSDDLGAESLQFCP